jgi:hypothetical protein
LQELGYTSCISVVVSHYEAVVDVDVGVDVVMLVKLLVDGSLKMARRNQLRGVTLRY